MAEVVIPPAMRAGREFAIEMLRRMGGDVDDRLMGDYVVGLCVGCGLYLAERASPATCAETFYRIADAMAIKVPPGRPKERQPA